MVDGKLTLMETKGCVFSIATVTQIIIDLERNVEYVN